MWRRMVCVGVVVFCFAGISHAIQPKPIELSTPKLGAMAFVRSMELNDMEAFRAVTIGGDEEYALFQPLVNMVGAAKDLERAAREKFGKAGRTVVRNSPAVGLELQMQESQIKVNGDTAIVTQKDQGNDDPLTLRKTSGGWKVDLTAIKNRKGMSAAAPGMKKMQEVFTASAADIRAGMFKTPEEASQAVLQRMQKAAASAAAR